VADNLGIVFNDRTPDDAAQKALADLRAAVEQVEYLHVGESPWPHPSIRDGVRFQFLRTLVTQPTAGTIVANLELLGVADNAHWRDVFVALGKSAVGQALRRWWEAHADRYEKAQAWITMRHRSYETIDTLARALAGVADPEEVATALTVAATDTAGLALEIELWVQRHTRWCSPLGQQLLLAHQTGEPGIPMDPLELVSALWIADRLGTPWSERLEDLAFDAVAQAQRPDGSFPAVTPLYDRSDFAYFAPSALGIGCLARFAARGGRTPVTERERRRLQRWEPVLAKGAAFLLHALVPGDRPGWHSDRHPAGHRIDTLATTEAVKALCRIDDVMKWLVNIEAYASFDVKWPQKAQRPPLATDLAKGRHQLLLVAMKAAESLRDRTSDYGSPRGAEDAHEPMHSLLFYGPPGTGKTSLQEWVAADLQWPLLVITVGDFLTEGEGNVGKKAVEIFRTLDSVSNTCIVFDEFDELVVDRSPRADHSGMRGAPALLTPTMLPLLSELRKRSEAQCCLVSFTTNYIASIDYAARRVGRVDREILLVYPDFASRLLLALTIGGSRLTYEQAMCIAERSALRGLGAVKHYIDDCVKSAEAAASPPPAAIEWEYYPGPTATNRYLANEIVGLIQSIGSWDMIEAFLRTDAGRGWSTLYQAAAYVQDLASRPQTTVTMVLRGAASVPDGAKIYLVGKGLMLGDWNPENALPLSQDGDAWRSVQSWPVGGILEFKFLWKLEDDARWQFEAGNNRKYIVPVTPPSEVSYVWRPPSP
jgi:hypothetical protein